jgi:hypothetical protein
MHQSPGMVWMHVRRELHQTTLGAAQIIISAGLPISKIDWRRCGRRCGWLAALDHASLYSGAHSPDNSPSIWIPMRLA